MPTNDLESDPALTPPPPPRPGDTLQTPLGTIVVRQEHGRPPPPPPRPRFASFFWSLVMFGSLMINVFVAAFLWHYFSSSVTGEVFHSGDALAKDKLAVVTVTGMITRDSIAQPKKEVQYAAEDDNVKGLLLIVSSPGGTIAGSDELYHAIKKFRVDTKKPVVVSMQGLATSGGYYISTPADVIVADRSCITASIGVISEFMTVDKLMDKVGVTNEVVKSGKMKDSGSPFRAMTPTDRNEMQSLIDKMYEQFLEVVLSHREKQVGGRTKLKEVADGRILLARDALAAGLIDLIGYEQDAISELKKLANLKGKVRLVSYDRPIELSLSKLISIKAPSAPPTSLRELITSQQSPFLLIPPMFLNSNP